MSEAMTDNGFSSPRRAAPRCLLWLPQESLGRHQGGRSASYVAIGITGHLVASSGQLKLRLGFMTSGNHQEIPSRFL
jgi:hypothetical protein